MRLGGAPSGARYDAGSDDDTLAEQTCAAAPADHPGSGGDHDTLAVFLADAERVESVRAAAQAEAEARAAEWGLADHLADE